MKTAKNFFLVALLVFAPLMLGAIHPWSIAVCLLLAAVLFSLEVFERGVAKNTPSLGVAGWVLLGAVGATLAQVVPLPAALVRVLSPRSFEITSSLHASLLGEPVPSFMPLSIAPVATLAELMKVAAAALLFLGVRQRVRKEGAHDVLRCVAFSGIAVAAVFFVHRLLGWERVYDFYEPLHASTSPLSAPLLNANHLAGLLGLAAAVAAGLAFSETERVRRLILITAAGFTGAGVFLTLSRGGILCFVGGQLLFVLLWLLRRLVKKEARVRRELKLMPLALAISLGGGLLAASHSILKEFLFGDARKVQIPVQGLRLLGDFWLTGSGRGSFSQAFTAVQRLPDTVTYSHAENFPVQWLSEWGILAGGAFIALVAAPLALGLLKPPLKRRNIGALVALVALAAQNLVDFSLEVTGVMLPFVTLLASEIVRIENAFGWMHGGRRNPGITKRLVPGWAGVLLAAAAVALAAGGFVHCSRWNIERASTWLRAGLSDKTTAGVFLAQAREQMRRHPADYYIPLTAGIKLYHEGSYNPLPYLSRSLRLFPGSSLAHFYVARTLARGGFTGQALVEYMEAVRDRPSMSEAAADEIVAMAGDFATAARMARTREDRLLVFEPLSAAFMRAGKDAESATADREILKLDPLAPGASARTARRLIAAGDFDGAETIVATLASEGKLRPLAFRLRAEREAAMGNLQAAVAHMLKAYAMDPAGQRDLLIEAAKLEGRRGNAQRMNDLFAQFEAGCRDELCRGAAAKEKGGVELDMKLFEKALASYYAAAAYFPDDTLVWSRIAFLAERKQDTAQQLKAYKELMRIEPDNPGWKQKHDAIQERLHSAAYEGE